MGTEASVQRLPGCPATSMHDIPAGQAAARHTRAHAVTASDPLTSADHLRASISPKAARVISHLRARVRSRAAWAHP